MKKSRVSYLRGKKLVRKDAGFRDNTQSEPSLLERKGYKVGSQGYPQNAEAFEREVATQDPHRHVPTDLFSRGEYIHHAQAAIPYTDFRVEKEVFEALNDMRERWGLVGGDFSNATQQWFKDHPADVIYLNMHKTSYNEARKWAGFKIGQKGKGRKVKRPKMTTLERKIAKKKSQQKRAKEARKEK